jgi:LAO/AO transport system kinase
VAINKADSAPRVARAQSQIRSALAMLRHASPRWSPPVLTVSALKCHGIDELWREIERYRETMAESGEFAAKRRHQALSWMWELIDDGLRHCFREHPAVRAELAPLSQAVEQGATTPAAAAHRLLRHWQH